MTITLSVLGTEQDAGVPHINCFCKNCSQAIRNPTYRRLAASLALVCPEENRWHLIDCTPDFREQMRHIQERYHLNGKPMDHIFLTHAHMGHFPGDRKSTRLNSSHVSISYAVFCLKKKK